MLEKAGGVEKGGKGNLEEGGGEKMGGEGGSMLEEREGGGV